MGIVAWGDASHSIIKSAQAPYNSFIMTIAGNTPPKYMFAAWSRPLVFVGEDWIRENCTTWYDTDKCQTVNVQRNEIPLDISEKDIIPYVAVYPVGKAYGIVVKHKGQICHHGIPLNVLKECERIEEQVPDRDIIQWVHYYEHSDFAEVLDQWLNEEYYTTGVPSGVRHVIRTAFLTVTGGVAVVCEPTPSSYAVLVYIDGTWIRWYKEPFRTVIGQVGVSKAGIYVDDRLIPQERWKDLWRRFVLYALGRKDL